MKVLVCIAPVNYRDEELEEPLSVLEEHGIGYVIASVKPGTCTGMLGGVAEASVGFGDVTPADFAGIVIVGGAGAAESLWGNERLHSLVRSFHEQGRVVAAICLSPAVLARAGILRGVKATVFRTPASVSEMKAGGAELVDAPVVSAGRIVTAHGPDAALAFGREIVSKLEH